MRGGNDLVENGPNLVLQVTKSALSCLVFQLFPFILGFFVVLSLVLFLCLSVPVRAHRYRRHSGVLQRHVREILVESRSGLGVHLCAGASRFRRLFGGVCRQDQARVLEARRGRSELQILPLPTTPSFFNTYFLPCCDQFELVPCTRIC